MVKTPFPPNAPLVPTIALPDVKDSSSSGWRDSGSSESRDAFYDGPQARALHPGINEVPSHQHVAHGKQNPIPGTIIIKSVSSLSPLSISFKDLMRNTTRRSLIALPKCFDNDFLSPSKAQQDQMWQFEDYLQTVIDHRYFDSVTMTLDDCSYSDTLFLNIDLVKTVVGALRKSTRVDLTVELDDQSLVALEGYSDGLNTCPHLRNFRWTSKNIGIGHELPRMYHLPWRSLKRGLFWQQLTNLSLQCPLSVDDAIYVLSQGARSLQSAQLASIKRQDAGVLIQQRITLLQLRSLDIQSYVSLHDLFSKLIMPALTSLSLRADTAGVMGVVQILDHRLNIRWDLLEDLTLIMDPHQICDLDPILSTKFGRSPALQRLTLSCPHNNFMAQSIPRLDHLSDLILDIGAPCDGLLILFQDQNLTKLEVSTLPGSRFSIPRVDILTIKETITVDDLCLLLQEQRTLRHGSFSVHGGDFTRRVENIYLEELEQLDLVSSFSLRPLWGALQAPKIQTLSLRFKSLQIADKSLELQYLYHHFQRVAVYDPETRTHAF